MEHSDLTAANPLQLVVADIGGTHARIALASIDRSQTIVLREFEKLACHQFQSLSDVLLHYQTLHAEARDLAWVIAIAAPILDNEVLAQANLPWQVNHAQLRADFPLQKITLLNDFVALAHAFPTIKSRETILLCGSTNENKNGPVLVIGPGTGLGAAIWLPGTPSKVLASEAGHAALAPTNEMEIVIWRYLKRRWQHVDAERILSGPGLFNCYQALCEIEGQAPHYQTPAAIAQAAMQKQDDIAQKSLSLFCDWLGSVIADLCIVVGAQRVLLAGGIPAQILPFLQRSDFVARFHDKGVMAKVMLNIPVQVVDHGQLALFGAAQWYLEQQ